MQEALYLKTQAKLVRYKNFTGSGVGMLAFGSPISAHATTPPLITISGFAPKKDGFHITRSANFPTCKVRHINAAIWMIMLKLQGLESDL